MSNAQPKQRIDIENGDIYGLHNAIETCMVQVGLTLLAVLLAWMTTSLTGASVNETLAIGSIALMLANAAVAGVMAIVSWRRRMPMEYSDWWDGSCALVLAFSVAGLATATGGFLSPVWLVVFAVAVYTGSVFVYVRGYVALVLLVLTIVASGWISGDWSKEQLAYGVGLTVVMSICLVMTKELGRVMYDLIWEMGQRQIALHRAIIDLREALERTASGDLTPQLSDGKITDPRLDVGTEFVVDAVTADVVPVKQSLDKTVANLRNLVQQIRSGGEEIATAAAEMVGTAQQQATSAAQQRGTVTETTATIEELATTAAQISDTAASVARVAQET
ncbi:MAG: methyl-accepting chemotaxis protein, partial [Candidatus Nanopelagicales bacterium]